jgi:hypothetical protein
MQVTELQVQRSLQALSGTAVDEPAAPEDDPVACPAGLVERLMGSPAIRDDRLAEARQRLEAGEQPSAEDLAQRMVGRLVCDRLR